MDLMSLRLSMRQSEAYWMWYLSNWTENSTHYKFILQNANKAKLKITTVMYDFMIAEIVKGFSTRWYRFAEAAYWAILAVKQTRHKAWTVGDYLRL